jgi:NitT/TauT family transport system substrate-binding protein
MIMHKHVGSTKAMSVLAVAVIAFCLFGCRKTGSDDDQTAVRIGYTPLVYAQPTFVALERHYFDESRVKVTVTRFENSTQILNAVIAGQLDFCAITPLLSVFAAQDQANKAGQKTALFKVMDYNTDSVEHPISFLLVAKDSPIHALRDLKGKRVGVFPGNILSRVSLKLLLKPHLDVDRDIVFQDVAPNLQAQALQLKQVDALFSLEPFATITLEGGDATILHTAPQIAIVNNLPGGCGVMSAKFVRQHPDLSRRFYTALQNATAYIRSNESEAKKVFSKYTPLTPELADKVRQPQFVLATETTGEDIQQEYDVLVREGVLSSGVDTKQLLYSQ